MENEDNWSVAVEDLVDGGNVEAAISLLESIVSKLETLNSSSSELPLASALTDLANLYSSCGLSLKADELRTRSFLIKQRAQPNSPSLGDLKTVEEKCEEEHRVSEGAASAPEGSASSDDDWEAMADHGPNEIFSPKLDKGISKVALDDTKFQTPKRRGRGSFLYGKDGLYSDEQASPPTSGCPDDEVIHHNSEEGTEKGNSRYGTRHVLVLTDFPPVTRTTELEKLFEEFKDRGAVIRWVSDIVALAVFRTPSIALEAQNSIHCPFTVRMLNKDDSLLCSISARDLEPPIPRPKTSARTAQRLIAHGMGLKLSEMTFGSSKLKKQEEARRNRLVSRQILRDNAWGTD